MDLGEHVGVMEQAGIPLRQVVNNENHRPWKRPTDPDGLWERALADPPRYVDFVIAFDGDLGRPGREQDQSHCAGGNSRDRTAACAHLRGAALPRINRVNPSRPAAQKAPDGGDRIRSKPGALAMNLIHQVIELLRNELGVVLSSTLARLLLAAILGGIIGLERQLRHKPAGCARICSSALARRCSPSCRATCGQSERTARASRRRSSPASASSARARFCTPALR